jgi:hypothetical protein
MDRKSSKKKLDRVEENRQKKIKIVENKDTKHI